MDTHNPTAENIVLTVSPQPTPPSSPSVTPSTEEYEDPHLPIYIDMRFTFDNQDKELTCLNDKSFMKRCKLIYKCLIAHLFENNYYYQNKYISGFETQSKTGENCKAHFHLRFRSTNIVSSMRRTVKRFLSENWDQSTTGNQAMKFTGIVVRNHTEFMQYPLKLCKTNKICGGYTESQIQVMQEVAETSYEKVVQINQKKMDTRDKTDTLFLKVVEKLKKSPPTNIRQIALAFLLHYLEENRPINEQTIKGYALNAAITLKLITSDTLLDKWGY